MRIRLGGSSATFENNSDILEQLKNHFEMMKTPKGNKLSDISIKSYVSKLNRLSVLCKNKAFDDDGFLYNADNVLKCLEKSDLKSKKDYIAAIVKYLSIGGPTEPSILKKYHTSMAEYKKKQTNERDENIATEKNVQNSLSIKRILEKLKSYKITNLDELFNAVIVAFYFGNTENLIPRNDLNVIKLITPAKSKSTLDPHFNYIVVNRGGFPEKIIMCAYKTAKTYGEQSFDMSPILKKLVFNYIKKTHKKPNDFLFTKRDGVTHYNPSTFARIIENSMREVIGKPINVDLVRQIVATTFYKNNPLASKKEKEDFAHRFLHSVSTNGEYMRKNLKI